MHPQTLQPARKGSEARTRSRYFSVAKTNSPSRLSVEHEVLALINAFQWSLSAFESGRTRGACEAVDTKPRESERKIKIC
jgi:hypothetical protein